MPSKRSDGSARAGTPIRERILDADVRALIGASIRSIWTLELLLLLRADRCREWSESELIREVRGSRAVVREGLAALVAAGLAGTGKSGGSVYQPRTPALDDAAERLIRAYQDGPTTVLKAIASAPDDRIQTFADAFRFKQ